MPKDLDQYIDWVIDQKPELAGLDPDILVQLKQDLSSRVEDQINAALLGELPKDRLGDLERLAESGTSAQVLQYLQTHIANFDEVVAGVLVRFKVSYLGA